MNKLSCGICEEPYQEPSMCPHCSEVFCFRCIREYLNRNYFCPLCGNHVIDLINCGRLIDEVKEKIKENNQKKRELQHERSLMREQCQVHKMPIKYECVTCGSHICSDCGLIDSKHKDHEIRPLHRIVPYVVEERALLAIQQKISDKEAAAKEEEKKLLLEQQLFRSQLKYSKSKIYEYYEQLVLRLELEAKEVLDRIERSLHECRTKSEEQSFVKTRIDSELSDYENRVEANKLQIEKELYQYLESNHYLPQQQPPESQSVQNSSSAVLFYDKRIHELSLMNEIYPEYHNFTFEVDYELNRNTELLYSPVYEVYGYEWRLKIYPQGNAQSFGEHASVFLELINSPQALTSNTAKEYVFRVELLNLNMAGKSIIKEYNSKFSVGECWGYAEFIALEELPAYLHEGKLLFVMGIKNVSYYDMCDNMKRFVSKLQGENKVLSELCQTYYINRSGADSSHESSSADESQISSLGGEISELHPDEGEDEEMP